MAELILNRYKAIEEAGKGGFGTVIVAWDTRMRRKVAIKQIPIPETVTKQVDEAGEHWEENIPGLSEARTAAMIQDANIVTVHDFEIENNNAYIIMEYVEGLTLTQFLHDYSDDMTLDMLTCIFNGVAHAIEVAHAENVLHLDIKPDNVLIDSKGKVKVTDFGLATLADEFGYGTANAGTVGYMPPEQMRKQALDVRSDEWALACITYEMLCGVNPFEANDIQTSLRKAEDSKLIVPSSCWEDISEDLDNAIFGALSPNPEDRFSTVTEFKEEMLEQLSNPRAGQKQLSALLIKDGEEETEPRHAKENIGKSRIIEGLTNNLGLTILGRAFALIACLPITILSCFNIDFLSHYTNSSGTTITAIGIIVCVVVSAVVVVWPPLGFALSLLVLTLAFIMTGNWVIAIILALATIAWGYYNFKSKTLITNTVACYPLFGSFGFAQFGPFATGLFCDVKNAAINTAFGFMLCLFLAALGSQSLVGWEPFTYGIFTPRVISPGAVQMITMTMLTQIQTWVWFVAWMATSILIAFSYKFDQRAIHIMAPIAGIVLMIVGICCANYLGSGMGSWQPQGWEILPTILAGAVAIVVAIFLPNRLED